MHGASRRPGGLDQPGKLRRARRLVWDTRIAGSRFICQIPRPVPERTSRRKPQILKHLAFRKSHTSWLLMDAKESRRRHLDPPVITQEIEVEPSKFGPMPSQGRARSFLAYVEYGVRRFMQDGHHGPMTFMKRDPAGPHTAGRVEPATSAVRDPWWWSMRVAEPHGMNDSPALFELRVSLTRPARQAALPLVERPSLRVSRHRCLPSVFGGRLAPHTKLSNSIVLTLVHPGFQKVPCPRFAGFR